MEESASLYICTCTLSMDASSGALTVNMNICRLSSKHSLTPLYSGG